jgi:hypothetical protein
VDVKTVLHLVRTAAAAGAIPAVADRDWVVYLQPARLVRGGAPHTAPVALGPINHDQLVDLLFAADLVVTW